MCKFISHIKGYTRFEAFEEKEHISLILRKWTKQLSRLFYLRSDKDLAMPTPVHLIMMELIPCFQTNPIIH